MSEVRDQESAGGEIVLTESEIDLFRFMADRSGFAAGPSPQSQQDGTNISAARRRELLAAGLVIAKPIDCNDNQVIVSQDGTRARACDFPYLITHAYHLTAKGRALLARSAKKRKTP